MFPPLLYLILLFGLLHRADYQPMLSSVQKASEVNMTMR